MPLLSRLPEEFIRSLDSLEHFDRDAFIAVHESSNQLVSVHMNPRKPVLPDGNWISEITEPPFEVNDKVPWAPDAWYLSERPSFTQDPVFHSGAYYVQEASGMFLAHAFNQLKDLPKKLKVLDLCAAPGGKSTMIQSLISAESLLVSNEVIKSRVPVLCQNMTKWGYSNSFVSNNDPSHFKQLPGYFDLIIVDAPCSGSGLFRKEPDAANEWSPDLVNLCSQRQQRILADAWHCLKENGFLIYSTCSYSKEENENILDVIFRDQECSSVPLHPDPDWNVVETVSDEAGAYGYRFYPDKLKGEGFFLAVIQKKQAVNAVRSQKTDRNNIKVLKSMGLQAGEWLREHSYEMIMVGDSVHALQPGLVSEFENLKNSLYLKKAGVRVGKAGEKEWIPDHELALSNILKKQVASLQLSRQQAIQFLRGEAFEPDVTEKGWRLVSYAGQHLGWVKLLDKRMNNYYPKSWRIRH